MHTIDNLIKQLNLEKHREGGYFYQTFYSEKTVQSETQGKRCQLTSIYYLLTKDSHISYFTRNKSDLVLYYHLGDPLKIIFLGEDGVISEKILGSDLEAGHQLQISCPANTCKAYELMGDNFCLVGEAVAPGFEYEDMEMVGQEELLRLCPGVGEVVRRFAVV